MIKYLCDGCGKELQTWAGYTVTLPYQRGGWATISVTLPPKPVKQPESELPGLIPAYPEQPTNLLVCSQACAEKALDEAKEQLRQAFQKVGESDPETCEIRVYPSEGRIEIKYARAYGELGKAVEDIANQIVWLHYRRSITGKLVYVTKEDPGT